MVLTVIFLVGQANRLHVHDQQPKATAWGSSQEGLRPRQAQPDRLGMAELGMAKLSAYGWARLGWAGHG